jgi:hypothetical protein
MRLLDNRQLGQPRELSLNEEIDYLFRIQNITSMSVQQDRPN